MKKHLLTTIASAGLLLAGGLVYAHCEIPCGIYGDKTRIDLLYEHAQTIEKSMTQIAALSAKQDALSLNQLTRWIRNKEEHANEVQHVVTQYFMTQRVKPAAPGDAKGHQRYVAQLVALHGMLRTAMKCKQTVDVAHTKQLRRLIDEFSSRYFSPADLEHLRKKHGRHE